MISKGCIEVLSVVSDAGFKGFGFTLGLFSSPFSFRLGCLRARYLYLLVFISPVGFKVSIGCGDLVGC